MISRNIAERLQALFAFSTLPLTDHGNPIRIYESFEVGDGSALWYIEYRPTNKPHVLFSDSGCGEYSDEVVVNDIKIIDGYMTIFLSDARISVKIKEDES